MPRTVIADTKAAGNAIDATIFTMPASQQGFISNIVAHNTTGGTLTLTLKIIRTDGITYTLLTTDSILTLAVGFYSKTAAKPVAPLTMNAGEKLLAQGSGAGINVTISGIRFDITT